MKLYVYRIWPVAIWLIVVIAGPLSGDELSEDHIDRSDSQFYLITNDFEEEDLDGESLEATPINLLQDQPPVELPFEQQPDVDLPSPASEFLALFSRDRAAIFASLDPNRQRRAFGPSINIVLGREAVALVTSDAGSLLRKSNMALGIASQNRTPIITDTLSRGRRNGQQAGSGSYWFPARQDLDTLLNKIDSRIIDNIITVKGPYSALYGPGLAFYDVELLSAPRYYCGFESHGSTSFDYQTNGEQSYGRQSLWGGNSDWGYRVGYGHRVGSDYEDGAGIQYPSSYNSRDFDVALGADLSDGSYLDFHYLRLDQTDVEFPGQIFDFDFYVTDAFDLKYVTEDNPSFDRLTLEGWYNRTRFEGNAQGAGTRRQVPFLDAIGLVSVTDVDATSTGFRMAMTWGETGCTQLTAGVDLRHLQQELNEISSSALNAFTPQNNPIPKSHQVNPGVFVEESVPLSDNLTIRTGGRFDWVSSDAAQFVAGADFDNNGFDDDLEAFLGASFDRNYNLGLAYINAEYQLNCNWSVLGGVGFSMRQPTMTELYAVTPFVAVFPQNVFTSPIGNPTLNPEKLYQVDLGAKADYGNIRAGVTGFYSWINDYIAFDALTPGVVYSYVNTDLATLIGVEAYADCDVSCWLTAFAGLSYIEGRDRSRNRNESLFRQINTPGTPRSLVAGSPEEPLPVISPLDSRAGLRIHQPGENPAWAVEVSARIVDGQNRIATTLQESLTPGFTTVDLRAYWQYREHLLLTFGVENLGDRNYQEHFDPRLFATVFREGTSFYFGTEWTY